MGRLVALGDVMVFSDETAIFRYDLGISQTGLKLVTNQYYECLCTIKSLDKQFKIKIANLQPVEGNVITIHTSRSLTAWLE